MKSTTATILSVYMSILGLHSKLQELKPVPATPELREVREFSGHVGPVLGVAFSSDGSMVAAGGADRSIRIWNVKTGQETLTLLGHEDEVTSVVFLPSGEELLSISRDKTARLWDLKNGEEKDRFEGSPEPLVRLALSSDGQRFLTSGEDNVTRLWDVGSGEQLQTFERADSSSITGLGFVSDANERIFIADGDQLRVWDVHGEKSTFTQCWKLKCAALTQDGKSVLIAIDDRFRPNLELRPIPTKPAPREEKTKGFRFYRVDPPEQIFSGHRRAANVLTICKDSKRCISGSGDDFVMPGPEFGKPDNTVRLWDLESGKEIALFRGHSGPILCLAVSPDGHFAVSAGADKTVRLLAIPD